MHKQKRMGPFSENNGESCLSLRLGFRQIKGLSKNDVDRIIKERGNGYNDPQDLWHRIRLSPSIIKLLIKANCFHSLIKTEDYYFGMLKL